MKKITTLVCAFLLINVFIQAQSYIPFPSNTAVWTSSYCYQLGGITDNFKIAMFGDTTINSVIYKKLYYSNDPLFDIDNSSYFAALREEEKEVYYIPQSSSEEYLLYDFTKTVGDTVKIYAYLHFPPNSTGSIDYRELKIDAIDSIMVDGVYRKRYYFSANGSFHQDEYWIEGIGSTFGMFHHFLSISDNGFNLRCLVQDNQLTYTEDVSTFLCSGNLPPVNCNDMLITGINQISPRPHNYLIFPNPTTTFLNIDSNNDNDKIKSVTLLTALGQEVLRSTYTGSNKIDLNIENFPSGVYYLKIRNSNNNLIIEKLLIEK